MNTYFNSWQWQLKNSSSSYSSFENVTDTYRFLETPYTKEFFSEDPILSKIYHPSSHELSLRYTVTEKDVMGDDVNSVMNGVVHKYSSRVLLLVNDICPMYCRYCTRKNSSTDRFHLHDLHKLYQYTIDNNVNEIILSGGDPFMLPNDTLRDYLSAFQQWIHIDIVRIHTKMLSTLPMRFFDEELQSILETYSDKLWIVTHFVSHREVNEYVERGVKIVQRCGVVLLNQNPVLKGVNDSPQMLQDLFYALIKIKIKPYYLFQIDQVDGTAHFYVDLKDVLSYMRVLQGKVTGIALPKVIVDIPHGKGKVPVENRYLIEEDDRSYKFISHAKEEGIYYKF